MHARSSPAYLSLLLLFLQEGLQAPVFDRFLLILQIFRSRARSREAQLQIEIASLGFLRSRLANAQARMAQLSLSRLTVSHSRKQKISLPLSLLGEREG
jgi:hypothetical protein